MEEICGFYKKTAILKLRFHDERNRWVLQENRESQITHEEVEKGSLEM